VATDYAFYRTASIPSTQDEARRRFAGEPFLVVADAQTAGRGRGGAEWISAPVAVAASLAFRLEWAPAELARVTLMAGMAAVAALGGTLGLKWPNDLLDDEERKVGGLLVEGDAGCMVAGLGVNLWWPHPPAGFGAVWRNRPAPDVAEAIARRWAGDLLGRFKDGPAAWGRSEYSSLCQTIGTEITWEGGAGVAVDVDDEGRLLVETDEGIRFLTSGAVRHVRRGYSADLDA
jgi:BirA family biotin operon repressor/biotin-[acetyl-CoA-carboxylase] ligase